MIGWREFKISEIGRVITGKTPSSKNPEEWGNKVAFVTPTDFDSYNKSIEGSIRYLSELGKKVFNSKILPPNSVIVTCIGSQMGKVAINKIPCVTNQQVNSIIVDDDFNPDFIYYLISSMQDYLRNIATGGSTMPIVNKSEFENIKLNIPELNTQTVIAEILSSFDDKIELNNKINQELENLAQTLFKQWFIDFEFPNENGEPYKSSGGEMVDSELGKIPKAWEVGAFGSLINVVNGYAFKSTDFNDFSEEGIIKIRNINGTSVDIINTDFVTSEVVGKLNGKFKVNPGEILIAMTGAEVGKIGIVATTNKSLWLNQRVGKIVAKNSGQISFVHTMYNVLNFTAVVRNEAMGSAQPNISSQGIESIKIVIPESVLIDKFAELFDDKFQIIYQSLGENIELINLRESLLPKLISGELEVNQTLN